MYQNHAESSCLQYYTSPNITSHTLGWTPCSFRKNPSRLTPIRLKTTPMVYNISSSCSHQLSNAEAMPVIDHMLRGKPDSAISVVQ